MNRLTLEEYDGPMDDQMLADLLNYSGQYPQEYMAANYGQPQYDQAQYDGPMTDQMVADLPSFSGPGWGTGADGTPTLTLAGNAGNAEFQGLGKYTSPADFAARDPAGFAKVNPHLAKTMPASQNPVAGLLDFAKNDPSVSIGQAKLMFNYEKNRQPGSESAVDIMRRNGNNTEQALREMQLAGMGNTAMQESYDELLKRRAQEARLTRIPATSIHLSEVVDPQNPSRMLRVDANQYRGGGVGSPGVIGISKMESAADAKREGAARKAAAESGEILAIADEAEKILPKAHGSGVGSAMGTVSNFLGIDSSKNAADAQLRVLSGALVSKMPRMQGPQSDKDVAMYKEMAGMVGDSSLPSSVRASALQTVKKLYGKYAQQEGAPAADAGNAAPAPNSADYQQTLFNAKKAIARNPAAREAILRKLRDNGYDTKGL